MENEKSFRRLFFEVVGLVLGVLFFGTWACVLFVTTAGFVPLSFAVRPCLVFVTAILLLVVLPWSEANGIIEMRILKRELRVERTLCLENSEKCLRADMFIGMFLNEDQVCSALMAMQAEHRQKCQEYERLLTSLTGPVDRALDAFAINSRLESAQGDIRNAEAGIRRAHEAAVSRGFKVPELKTYLPGA